jgi:hypothetical protein
VLKPFAHHSVAATPKITCKSFLAIWDVLILQTKSRSVGNDFTDPKEELAVDKVVSNTTPFVWTSGRYDMKYGLAIKQA